MQRGWKTTLFFSLSLSFLFTSVLFAQNKPTPAQRWEYKTVNLCVDNRDATLNELGDEGWELNSQSDCNGLFRRPKPANAPKFVRAEKKSASPKPTPTTCNLTAAQAPTIRGLRLGMTVDELLELFPGANPIVLKRRVEDAKAPSSFGSLGYNFDGSQHKDPLEGFHFSVQLFDGRLRSFQIQYPFSNRTSYGNVYGREDFITRLSESLKLPAKENWKFEHYDHAYLYCQGFKLETDFQGRITISIEDVSQPYQEILKERYKESLFGKRTEFKP
jgi:hypothetical protein